MSNLLYNSIFVYEWRTLFDLTWMIMLISNIVATSLVNLQQLHETPWGIPKVRVWCTMSLTPIISSYSFKYEANDSPWWVPEFLHWISKALYDWHFQNLKFVLLYLIFIYFEIHGLVTSVELNVILWIGALIFLHIFW